METNDKTPVRSYRDLRIYQRSYQAALTIHQFTLQLPAFERGELGSQLRRASKSIPINIAEGYGRKSSPDDFRRFLVIALGSCDEVSVLLDFARDLKYLGDKDYARLKAAFEEIGKGLNKAIQVWR